MSLSAAECTAHIAHFSALFADATRDNLDGRVEHCPDWSVADLVWHLTEVHWFWATIADGRLPEPPDEAQRPERPGREALVETFEAGAQRLVRVLADADQSAACWTWFPGQQDIAFITRHQVQEAAVHTWDAVHAAGGTLDIDPVVAADSVDEFLTVSLAEEDDAREHDLVPLEATFGLRATDTADAWTLTDGGVPGSVVMSRGVAPDVPTLEAPAADLLLWLYRRRDLDPGPVPREAVDRFRGLSSTD